MFIKHIKRWGQLVSAILVMSGIAIFLPVPTAHAAGDYPKELCEFTQTSKDANITAKCTDDSANGTFNGKVFKKDGDNKFSLTETAQGTYKRNNAGAISWEGNKVTCKSTITVKDGLGTISGKYLKSATPTTTSSTVTTNYGCQDVAAGQISLNGSGIGSGKEGDDEPVCSAGALGWIICPAMDFISTANDAVYGAVESMLLINPIALQNGGSLYTVWTRFRDLANILFVITFLVVIFSQATSMGLSSYGVKKMLPRILAAAILVNLSFFICQIAVDMSNIVGTSMAAFVGSFTPSTVVDVNWFSWSGAITAIIAGGAGYAGIAAILGAESIMAALAMLLPFLVTALFAVVTALVVLIARQVIIILLVAISPLAFVAFILPNTQKYFQMWQNTMTTMLVMFPLVALLFAGSKLAADIVLTTSTTPDGISLFALIAAISMLFMPLFGVPYIVKFSGGAIGRLAGLVNDPNKGPFDAMRKRAEGYRDYKKDQGRLRNARGEFADNWRGRAARNTFGRYSRRQVDREAIRTGAKREADQAASGYVAEKAVRDERFADRMAGGAAYQGSNIADARRRVQAQGIDAERQESAKRVKAIRSQLFERRLSNSQLDGEYEAAAARGDYETAAAVLQEAKVRGESGRTAAADMARNHAVATATSLSDEQKARARNEVQQAVFELGFDTRQDMNKGHMDMDTGLFVPKKVQELGVEHVAVLDHERLNQALNSNEIDRDVAYRIVTTNLRDKVQDTIDLKKLHELAGVEFRASNSTSSQQAPLPPGAAGGISGDVNGPEGLWIPRDRN